MKAIEYAKEIICEAEGLHRDYMTKRAACDQYAAMPWWKRIMVKQPDEPRLNYLRCVTVKSSYGECVEVRVYYTGTRREVAIAINEGGQGYKVNARTGERSPLLGSRGENISSENVAYMAAIRSELAAVLN